METFNTSQETKLQMAREHVEKLKGFYSHLTVYLIFVPIFITINILGGSNFPWAIFPIVGWGIGIAGHAAETYNWSPFFGRNWEQRKIKEFMDAQ